MSGEPTVTYNRGTDRYRVRSSIGLATGCTHDECVRRLIGVHGLTRDRAATLIGYALLDSYGGATR